MMLSAVVGVAGCMGIFAYIASKIDSELKIMMLGISHFFAIGVLFIGSEISLAYNLGVSGTLVNLMYAGIISVSVLLFYLLIAYVKFGVGTAGGEDSEMEI